MKKVVFVIESLQCGGAEKSLVTLLQNMDFEKFQVDLIIMEDYGVFKKFVPNDVNIKVIDVFFQIKNIKKQCLRINFALKRKLNNKFHNAQLYWQTFGKSIKEVNETYDIAIAYNQGMATYFVAEKITSTKKFAWLNIDYQKAGYNINFDIDKYQLFTKVVTVSKECEESFISELKKYGYHLETTVIKDITDVAVVNKLSIEHLGLKKYGNTINICSVGRLAEQKGWHFAVEALELLLQKNKNVKWFIIGEGPKRQDLELLIKQKQLENNLILLGYKENPYPYIKSCDIYAQTSLFEGLGLTVIEAAILCKPIVTTNFPTASSIISNNETGLICDMTPLAIANSIERYLTDADLKQKVIKNLSLATNNDKETSLKKVGQLLNS